MYFPENEETSQYFIEFHGLKNQSLKNSLYITYNMFYNVMNGSSGTYHLTTRRMS